MYRFFTSRVIGPHNRGHEGVKNPVKNPERSTHSEHISNITLYSFLYRNIICLVKSLPCRCLVSSSWIVLCSSCCPVSSCCLVSSCFVLSRMVLSSLVLFCRVLFYHVLYLVSLICLSDVSLFWVHCLCLSSLVLVFFLCLF